MNKQLENHMHWLKKLITEFKAFALRGNVVELAVGIIIGSSFSKIVSSLVGDIIMPPLGIILGGINLKDVAITLKPAVYNNAGKLIQQAVRIEVGNFFQATVDFIIVAFALFIIIKMANHFNSYKLTEQ
ncbi:MAG TPA: large conductance mechanosensitive channel protein MscL, partial [Candidatus Babeliaceae bacterium]|nr:large conductance mechanosensitive channel protein MscL [Candidatus Babeliaceae bacterium]